MTGQVNNLFNLLIKTHSVKNIADVTLNLGHHTSTVSPSTVLSVTDDILPELILHKEAMLKWQKISTHDDRVHF